MASAVECQQRAAGVTDLVPGNDVYALIDFYRNGAAAE
jgi:hypothetical protein